MLTVTTCWVLFKADDFFDFFVFFFFFVDFLTTFEDIDAPVAAPPKAEPFLTDIYDLVMKERLLERDLSSTLFEYSLISSALDLVCEVLRLLEWQQQWFLLPPSATLKWSTVALWFRKRSLVQVRSHELSSANPVGVVRSTFTFIVELNMTVLGRLLVGVTSPWVAMALLTRVTTLMLRPTLLLTPS